MNFPIQAYMYWEIHFENFTKIIPAAMSKERYIKTIFTASYTF
jgi:hypothetical protein